MSRNPTRTPGANAIATATQDQVEAALAYINKRLMLDAELIHARNLCIGYMAAVTYFAEGFGNTKLGDLECLNVTAAPSRAKWGVIRCDPLLRRALKAQGVVFFVKEQVA